MPFSVRNQQDLAAGLLCVAIGGAGLWGSFGYRIGSALRMGPGYFPALVFGALALCGLVLLVRAFAWPGERLDRWAWRPLIIVLIALLVFGLAVERLGFVLSSVLLVIVACGAGARLTVIQVLALAIGLTLFCALVFVVGLGLPLPVWPDFAL